MSSDVTTPVSFRLNDDFVVHIGADKKTITIPRLKFKNAGKLIGVVSSALAEDAVNTFKIMGEAKKVDVLFTDGKVLRDYGVMISDLIPQILKEKNVTFISKLLKIVSEEVITDELIEEMDYSEATGLLTHLINENFASKKNLDSCLKVISTTEKK